MYISTLFAKRLFASLIVLFCLLLNSKIASCQTSQIFTANGTWTCPAGVSSVTVQCWGGGGAGGSARASTFTTATGGGGAGGAYVMSTISVVPLTTYAITVATSVSSESTNNGVANGKLSAFSLGGVDYVKATGGSGGVSKFTSGLTSANGAGGIASLTGCIGTIKNIGGSGVNGNLLSAGGGSSAGILSNGNSGLSFVGGTSPYGGGAGGNGFVGGKASDGLIPGGGGGGASSLFTSSVFVGGAGARGEVRITYAACPNPAIAPANPIICAGSVQPLSVDPSFNTVPAPGSTGGTSVASNTSFPNPLSSYYSGNWTQCLVTVAQLSGWGFIAGSKISSLSLNVAFENLNVPLTNFTIEMGAAPSSLINLSGGFYSNVNTVYTSPSYTVIRGVNTWNFTTPFYWDGASNVVVSFIFSGTTSSFPGGGSVTYYGTSAANRVRHTQDVFGLSGGNITTFKNLVAASGSGTTSNQFPNITFTGSNPATTWSPTATLYTDAGATNPYTGAAISNVYAKPSVTTTYTVNADNGACQVPASSTVSISTSPQWTGIVSNDWNMPGNWCSGVVPDATSNVVIPAAPLNQPVIFTADAVAKSVTIAGGATLTMQGVYNLTISDAGSFTNGGYFDATASTTGAFICGNTGAGTVTVNGSAITIFKNITSNNPLALSTRPIIDGNFTINAGAVSGTIAPKYTANSTLIYNVAGAYITGLEWSAGAASTTIPDEGIPQNVTILDGIITIPNTFGANRALAGNLTISSGKTLQMTVASSRDLYILGNWINNGGIFNANGRKVTFDAVSGTQLVSGNTTFYDLTLDNATATTDFGSSVNTINDEFRTTAGTMTGNTSTFIFSGISCKLEGPRSKFFYNVQLNNTTDMLADLTATAGVTHVANSFINNGTFTQHNTHTFYFDNSGATESFTGTGTSVFGNLTIGKSGFASSVTLNCDADFTVAGGSMTFYNGSIYNGNNNTATFSAMPATVMGSGTANFWNATTNVTLNLGSSPTNSIINNNLTLNPNGAVITNAPVYGGGATLIYNTAMPTLNTSIEWKNNTSSTGGAGAPVNVIIQSANDIVMNAPDGNKLVPGTLKIVTATLGINNLTLTVNGAITGAGSLIGSQTSGLVLGGTATALLFTPGIYNNYLKTFTINTGGSATLGNGLNITASDGVLPNSFGTVTVNSGGVLNSGGNLTLKSDALGTAQVGVSMGTINDEVTVERFFPSRLAWRFIGIPFSSSSQSINQAWQEGNTDVVLQCPPQYPGTPGYGTAITFNNTNGYDVHNNNYKTSMQVYQNNMWVTPASTNSNFVTTPGSSFPAYSLFIRGDRSVCLTGIYPSTATTLRPKGVLNQVGGAPVAHNLPAGSANDYLLAGNPYASSVDIKSVMNSASGIYPDKFWIWDPKLAGSKGYGSYVAFSLSGGIFTPDDPGYTAGTTIQSGQAFMVQRNSSGTASLSFKEADKNTYQDVNVFGLRATQLNPFPAAAVFINLVDTTLVLLDGVGASLSNKFSAAVDSLDVGKLWNSESEKIALIRDEEPLAIELMPVPQNDDTLFVRLYLRQQPYKLKIYSRNLPGGLSKAWVVDKYLNTQTAINLRDTTLYSFAPNTDTNSYRNRFMLVLDPVKRARPARIDTLISRIKARIYPNPVTGKMFSLTLDNATDGNYTLNIYNAAGRLIAARTINYAYGQHTYAVTVPAGITSGTYIVQVMNDKGIAVGSMPLVMGR